MNEFVPNAVAMAAIYIFISYDKKYTAASYNNNNNNNNNNNKRFAVLQVL